MCALPGDAADLSPKIMPSSPSCPGPLSQAGPVLGSCRPRVGQVPPPLLGAQSGQLRTRGSPAGDTRIRGGGGAAPTSRGSIPACGRGTGRQRLLPPPWSPGPAWRSALPSFLTVEPRTVAARQAQDTCLPWGRARLLLGSVALWFPCQRPRVMAHGADPSCPEEPNNRKTGGCLPEAVRQSAGV